MKTNLSFSNPAEVETECLVAVALDRGEKDRPQVSIETSDAAVKDAATDVIARGEAAIASWRRQSQGLLRFRAATALWRGRAYAEIARATQLRIHHAGSRIE